MGGSSSGGGARTPYEAPNALSSAQLVRIVDVIAEGVLSGFANGDDAPFKSVFFNDTPVQNANGSYNFKGVQGVFQRGTPDQGYVPGFDSTERTVAVSSAVKHDTPIVRAVTDPLINRLRVTVGVERNVRVEENGDSLPATTSMMIELVGATTTAQTVTFTEKSSGAYYQDVVFETLPSVPFNLRVTRTSPDSTTDKLQNNTFFASYVEIIDAKLSYPHTALACLKIDSDQFGNQIPRRNYLLRGKIVQVPSNYNPETRTYSAGLWDGSFKAAWSNNPAWVFYDLLTQPRYSTLARRLNAADVDKWSLYAIARYCDELVDDGFGGKEPRFVCNAYITDVRQAGELLTDLASVFRGLPIWNGNQVSVVMDCNTDPVASYNNSNVVDGTFTYSGVSLKAIHTAVNVQYLDKNDGYRAKTEYVADDKAIARYGLNIKSVTAFGCDSRGQAARFGAWTLATELSQQNGISFTVAREGMRHLPYDIIQVADNDYAGAQIGGRIVSVSGNEITLDRAVENAVGAMLHLTGKTGVTAVKVMAQSAPDKLTVESVPETVADTWVLSAQVKPRLYRAIGIKENTEEGTYTISALQHNPDKYPAVDSYASFDREITTLHTSEPVVFNANHAADGDAVVVKWDNLGSDGALSYDIEVYRDGKLYRNIPDADTPEVRLVGLPNGNYSVKIRARNARGQLSAPITRAFSLNYDITALKTDPQMFAIKVSWTVPQTVISNAVTEVWYGKTNNLAAAQKLVSLPCPQNTYTLGGVGITDTYYFWARMTDDKGITGEFTAPVGGQCDRNPAPIIAQIQGSITQSALAQDLLQTFNAAAAQTQRVDELVQTAATHGTRITAVENVNTTQSQQIVTVTAAQNGLAAGLEAEKQARIAGDAAEASARETLAARVNGAESSITTLNQTVVSNQSATATQITEIRAELSAKNVNQSNLINTSAWAKGYTFSSPVTYNGAASQTTFVDADTPLGVRKAVMQCTADSTGNANGGFNSLGSDVIVNPAKIHRFAILARRVSGDGYLYWGPGYNTINALNTDTADFNSYFVYSYTLKIGVWYLFVGYVYPVGSTGYTHEGSGIWDLSTGQKIQNGLNFTKRAGLPSVSCRAYQYYSSPGSVAQFSDPMVHEINGSEPSLQSLIDAGKVQAMYSLKVEAVANGRTAVAGIALGADGVTGDTQFLVKADKFAVVNHTNTGQIKTPFAVVTENGATKMVLDGDMYASGTILGKHIAAGQTLSAPNISGGTITGGTINGTTINGGTITGGIIQGGRIEGAVIVGGRIEGVDGVFSGKVYIDNLLGGMTSDSAQLKAPYWKATDVVAVTLSIVESTKWFRAVFIVDSSKAERILRMDSLGNGSSTASLNVTCKTSDGISLPKLGQVTLPANRSFTFEFLASLRDRSISNAYSNMWVDFTVSYTTTPTGGDGTTLKTIRAV